MRRYFFLFLVLTPFFLRAQDMTGVWQGHFRSGNSAMRSSLFDDRYKFEVQIAQTNKGFEAITYSYLSTIFYGKAAATGSVNSHTGKVLLQEGKLLEVRNQSGDVCIMTCFLQYTKSGGEEFLEGTYVSMNVRDSSNCGKGTVFLRKVPTSDFYKEPFLVKKEKDLAGHKPEATVKAGPPKGDAVPKKPGVTKAPAGKPAVTAPGTAKTGKPAAGAPAVTAPGTAKAGTPPAKPGVTAKTEAPAKKPAAGAPAKPSTPKTETPSKGDVAVKPPVVKPPHPAVVPKEAPVKNPPPMAKVAVPGQRVRSSSEDSTTGMSKRFPTITPRILQTRSNPVVRTITVHVNEVTLNIYDDGAIDHDTISVYLDNKQVISHAMLTDRPLVLTLHLDESSDYHELVMVAENEGEIPPNTSLMIVKAGDKEYEVRITSTGQKNAMVTFKYSKQP